MDKSSPVFFLLPTLLFILSFCPLSSFCVLTSCRPISLSALSSSARTAHQQSCFFCLLSSFCLFVPLLGDLIFHLSSFPTFFLLCSFFLSFSSSSSLPLLSISVCLLHFFLSFFFSPLSVFLLLSSVLLFPGLLLLSQTSSRTSRGSHHFRLARLSSGGLTFAPGLGGGSPR